MSKQKTALGTCAENVVLKALCMLIMGVLLRALYVLSKTDTRFKEELALLPEGIRYALCAGPGGPWLRIQVKEGHVLRCDGQAADVEIRFKSIRSAARVFTGLSGIAQAYAQHRFTLGGDISLAMPLVRLIDIAEGYLFPGLLTRRFLRGPVVREKSMLYVYARVLMGK